MSGQKGSPNLLSERKGRRLKKKKKWERTENEVVGREKGRQKRQKEAEGDKEICSLSQFYLHL